MKTAFMLRHAILAAAAWALISSSQAITQREWESKSLGANPPISIVLEPISNGQVRATRTVYAPGKKRRQKTRDNMRSVALRPAGGYVGMVALSVRGGASVEFPLTVSFSFPVVSTDDILPPPPATAKDGEAAGEPDLRWHLPMGLLNPDAPLRHEAYRRDVTVTSSSGSIALPLLLPRLTGMAFTRNDIFLSCLCEVKDNRGNVLARKRLVELFSLANLYDRSKAAWVMNEPEADRYLREYAGISKSSTIDEMPPSIEPCSEIDALWVSAAAVNAGKLPADMLRRCLLMGIWVYGHPGTVSNMAAIAGLPAPGAVLMGGIQALGPNLPARQYAHRDGENSLWESFCARDSADTNAAPVFENRRDLFEPFRKRYIGWTVAVLGLFFLIACIGLPTAFWLLKGSRRLLLWWMIPAAAVIISALGLAGGMAFLPRQAQSDITEYRFAHAGWPEVYCRSLNRLLTFETRSASWSLPAQGFVFPAWRYHGLTGVSTRDWLSESPGLTSVGKNGLKRGQIVIDETAFFSRMPLPVELDRSAVPPRLKAVAPLRRAHVWRNGSWHAVGDLAPGQVIDVSGGHATNAVYGLPDVIAGCFPSYHNDSGPCKNCGKVHENKPLFAESYSNIWVVAAMGTEPAKTRSNVENARAESRIVWLIQIPVTADKPPRENDGVTQK